MFLLLTTERLLICYSSVGHDEWRNVAWCHRITDGNLAVPSSGRQKSQVLGLVFFISNSQEFDYNSSVASYHFVKQFFTFLWQIWIITPAANYNSLCSNDSNRVALYRYCHKIPFRDGKKSLFCYIFCKFRLDSAKRLKNKIALWIFWNRRKFVYIEHCQNAVRNRLLCQAYINPGLRTDSRELRKKLDTPRIIIISFRWEGRKANLPLF